MTYRCNCGYPGVPIEPKWCGVHGWIQHDGYRAGAEAERQRILEAIERVAAKQPTAHDLLGLAGRTGDAYARGYHGALDALRRETGQSPPTT